LVFLFPLQCQSGDQVADDSAHPPASGQGRKLPVLFIHDAAIDDFVATLLLVAMPNVDLKGIVIADADCIPQPGIDAANRLQQFMGRPDIPLALSESRGWNPFPWPYRGDCVTFGEIPSLRPYRSTVPTPPPSGNKLVAKLLEQAVATGDKLTVLLTTGFTPLTDIIRARPELWAGIDRVVWMGGAINVQGNLDPSTINPVVANKHAEWNVFWDPFAAQDGLDMLGGIHDFPLDITNDAPINDAPIAEKFKARLRAQGKTYSFSQLAYEAYGLVAAEPFYCMWDVCATVFLARPDLYAPPRKMKLEVVQWGFEQGWLRQSSDAKNTQNVYLSFSNRDAFYDYVVSQLARSA
jgi:purine nucleosidase